MHTIDRVVNAARLRLNANALTGWLATGVLAGSGLWVLVVAVGRLFAPQMPDWSGLAAGGAVAAAITLIGGFGARVGRLGAAVAFDTAAGLKERLSTALAVARSGDPFAEAVVSDAGRAAAGLRVGVHLPYRAPGLWPWSLAGLTTAVLFYVLMPQMNLLASSRKPDREQRPPNVAEATAVKVQVNEQLARVREMAAQNKRLADLAQKLDPLQMKEGPETTPDDVRREALKRIDSVKDKLEREATSPEMNAMRELTRQLSKLEPQRGDDAASKLSEALASGEMKAAREAMEQLKKAVEEAQAKGDEQSRQQLEEMSRRLEELSKQLERAAEDRTQMSKELENKAGLSKEEAEKLLEQLSKMDPQQMQQAIQQAMEQSQQCQNMSQQQMQQMAQQLARQLQQKMQSQQQCQALAQALAQCAQCANPGPGQGQSQDGESMAALLQQLSELEASEQLMQDMQAAMAELKKMRESVCRGDGDDVGQQGPEAGIGFGSRIGREKAAHQYEASKARVRLGNGEIIGQMLIDGPQVRGEASAEVRDAVNAAVRDAQDAVQRQDVPSQYAPSVQSYFERLAGLLRKQAERERTQPGGGDKPAGDTD